MSITPEEFVRTQVFNGCKALGLPERESADWADVAVKKFRRNQFDGKPLDLINSQIMLVKRQNKKKRAGK